MAILSLDLGTQTGWALRLLDGRILSGSVSFRPQRYEGGGMRYVRFSRWLDEIYELYPFQMVGFEEVRRHAAVDAAHCYGGLLATLSAWCETKQVPYQGIPVGTIKKAATGKGNANKRVVMQSMLDKGHKPVDDNEADALALLYCLLKSNEK